MDLVYIKNLLANENRRVGWFGILWVIWTISCWLPSLHPVIFIFLCPQLRMGRPSSPGQLCLFYIFFYLWKHRLVWHSTALYTVTLILDIEGCMICLKYFSALLLEWCVQFQERFSDHIQLVFNDFYYNIYSVYYCLLFGSTDNSADDLLAFIVQAPKCTSTWA